MNYSRIAARHATRSSCPSSLSEFVYGVRSVQAEASRCSNRQRWWTGARVAFAGLLALTAFDWKAQAEDADRFRSYLHWRVGEFAPAWGVMDLRGISFGANLDRHWSVELALDAWQLDFDAFGESLGEVQVVTLAPQARFRVPMWKDRLVPYLVAGVGGSWMQFNDRTLAGIGHEIDAEGVSFSATAGAGLDLFLADNIAFNVEGKYVWCGPISTTIDGQKRDWEGSSFLATLGLRIYFDENDPKPLLTKSGALRPGRFYFGTQAGFSVLTDGDWVAGAKVVPKLNALGDTLNLNYTLSLGCDFGEHLGLELAVAHTEYSIFLAGRGTVGEYSMYSAMPMLRLRFPSASGRWVPYLLAGAGISYGEFNDVKPNGADLNIVAKGLYPALAVGGGVDYFIARNVSFNFESRWRYAWNHKIEVPGGLSGRGDLSELQFTIGFRAYLFEFGKKQ